MSEDPRCCGSGTCIINIEGRCWCGQQWDGQKMCHTPLAEAARLMVQTRRSRRSRRLRVASDRRPPQARSGDGVPAPQPLAHSDLGLGRHRVPLGKSTMGCGDGISDLQTLLRTMKALQIWI